MGRLLCRGRWRGRARPLAAVVVAAGGDADLPFGGLVDETMLVGDPARPVVGEVVLEGLWFAETLIAVADDVADQQVDALEDLAVLGLPPQVVLPGVGSQISSIRQSASTRSWGWPSPASRRSMASSSRRALVGERMR